MLMTVENPKTSLPFIQLFRKTILFGETNFEM
jgi:hypothetical protein